jgi:hypothetical protein
MVEANIYSKKINKIFKIGLGRHTFLDLKWGLPQAKF